MSDPLHLHIEAVDTLMFRDGRPFNQHDAGAAEAVSVFPPYPPTIVGAVRLALAKAHGFDGTGSTWPEDIVGTGVDWQGDATLGPLQFSSIMVLHGEQIVFPVPLSVVEGHDASGDPQMTCLRPGAERDCDLGAKVHLPVPARSDLQGIKSIDDRWLSEEGMEAVLAGRAPDRADLVARDEVWRNEPRVGIGIDIRNRRVNEGQLYMASHVRPGEATALYIEVSGTDLSDYPTGLTPLAGEHRMANISSGERVHLPTSPSLKTENGAISYTVIHLSPCLLDRLPRPGESLDNLPGKVVSACLGRPRVIGGWYSVQGRAIAMRPALPAGSVWFMETKQGEPDPTQFHATHIGKAPEWGFGQILIGVWG